MPWVAYISITDTDFTPHARRGRVLRPSQSAGFTRARAAGHWHTSRGGAKKRDPHKTREGARRAANAAAALAIAVLVASESRLSHPKITSRTQLQADALVDRGGHGHHVARRREEAILQHLERLKLSRLRRAQAAD